MRGLTLRWDDADRTAGELRLRDTKTGARRVPLTLAAEGLLAGPPRIEGNPWVIAGQKPGCHLVGIARSGFACAPEPGSRVAAVGGDDEGYQRIHVDGAPRS